MIPKACDFTNEPRKFCIGRCDVPISNHPTYTSHFGNPHHILKKQSIVLFFFQKTCVTYMSLAKYRLFQGIAMTMLPIIAAVTLDLREFS